MKKTNRITYVVSALICLILLIITVIGTGGGVVVHASTVTYSGVSEDLKSDESFNAEDYPAVYNDYSLQVIQLAESKDKELLIYVYQPSSETKELTATTLRLSTDRATWKDYKLDLLNSDGVFQKYKVNGLKVGGGSVRYYDIAAIHRAWVRGIDDSAGGDNTVDEVVYEVAQLWTVFTVNGEVHYEMTKTDVVTITNKYVGYIRYSNGFKLYKDSCDAHFIAFSTDHKIDNLMQADVEYVTSAVQVIYAFGSEESRVVGAPVSCEKTLDYNDIGGNRADGWWSDKVEYHRIESAKEFAENENFDSATKTELLQFQWVLRFAETDYEATHNITAVTAEYYTEVSEVTILRLKFETAGVTYNLGVVDNKQTGSLEPIKEIIASVPWWVWLIVAVVLLIVIAIVLQLLGVFLPVFKAILQVLWFIICLPFKGIAALIRKIRGD